MNVNWDPGRLYLLLSIEGDLKEFLTFDESRLKSDAFLNRLRLENEVTDLKFRNETRDFYREKKQRYAELGWVQPLEADEQLARDKPWVTEPKEIWTFTIAKRLLEAANRQ
ncbi:MAG: hypothetical protein Q7S00_00200 [bacterium]|nr:hypothetical protein [bacterium]